MYDSCILSFCVSEGGLACRSPWGHIELDVTEWLNWTDTAIIIWYMYDNLHILNRNQIWRRWNWKVNATRSSNTVSLPLLEQIILWNPWGTCFPCGYLYSPHQNHTLIPLCHTVLVSQDLSEVLTLILCQQHWIVKSYLWKDSRRKNLYVGYSPKQWNAKLCVKGVRDQGKQIMDLLD